MRKILYVFSLSVIWLYASERCSAAVITTEQILNGGFESSFANWNTFSGGSGSWAINGGLGSFTPPGTTVSPITGNADAVASGSGQVTLWQVLTLPALSQIDDAVLTWSDRLFSDTPFIDGVVDFDVDLFSADGSTLLANLYSASGSPVQPGPNNRLVDLTTTAQSFANQQVRLQYTRTQFAGNFNTFLDNVSFQTSYDDGLSAGVPEPSAFALLTIGLGICGWRKRRKSVQASN